MANWRQLGFNNQMQKQGEKKVAGQSSHKKKKNAGWNNSNAPKTNEFQPSLSAQKENTCEPQTNVPQKDQPHPKEEPLALKKLADMNKTYHLEMGVEIGSGFASVVYLGYHIQSKEMVCVKVIDYFSLGGERERKALLRQIKYLRQFDSPHVVRLLDAYESPSFCYLVMEFCRGGDLFKFLMHSTPFHPLFARQFVQQICDGLLELQKQSLIHRDLKTENIFLGEHFQVKIGDLGFCIAVGQTQVIHNVGSPIYMSPEVLDGGAHSFESDIYGLGIIWYELLHQRAPWQAKSEPELLAKKMNQPVQFQRPDLEQGDREMIKKCLANNPKERCSLQQILQYCCKTNAEQAKTLIPKDLPPVDQPL